MVAMCLNGEHLIERGSIRPTTSAKGKTGGTRWRKTKDPVRTAWLPTRVVASNQGCLLIRQEMAFCFVRVRYLDFHTHTENL